MAKCKECGTPTIIYGVSVTIEGRALWAEGGEGGSYSAGEYFFSGDRMSISVEARYPEEAIKIAEQQAAAIKESGKWGIDNFGDN